MPKVVRFIHDSSEIDSDDFGGNPECSCTVFIYSPEPDDPGIDGMWTTLYCFSCFCTDDSQPGYYCCYQAVAPVGVFDPDGWGTQPTWPYGSPDPSKGCAAPG